MHDFAHSCAVRAYIRHIYNNTRSNDYSHSAPAACLGSIQP
jgi:hypothetical protein